MRSWLAVLVAQLDKQLIMLRRYWVNTLAMMVTSYLVLTALYLGGAAMVPEGAEADPARFAGLALGVVLWQVAQGATLVYNQQLSMEAFTGTLQQLYMSKAGITAILVSRAVADFATSLVVHAIVLAAVVLTFDLAFHFPVLEMAMILVVTMLGMWGFGFMVGGATLLWKRITGVVQLVQFLLLVLAGVLVPLERLPGAVRHVGSIIPLTHGISMMRSVMVDGLGVSEVGPQLIMLVLSSTSFLVVGFSVFLACDKLARRRGALGGY